MWLNFISKVSSLIHRTKEKIIDAGILKTIGWALVVIFLEIFLLIISLPIYIFITPERFSQDKNEVEKYRLKRKVSLIGVAGFILILLAKTFLFGGLFFTTFSNVRALSVSWSFDNPVDYVYDSSQIQLVDGMVIFGQTKAKTAPPEGGAPIPTEIETPVTEPTAPEETTPPVESGSTEPSAAPSETAPPAEGSAPSETPAAPPVESAPPPTAPPAEAPAAPPAGESSGFWRKILETISVQAQTTPSQCVATIQPLNSLTISDIVSWTGFVEIASKTGGEIYYQLSDDDGQSWYYWDNENWVSAGENQYNNSSIIDSKIKKFPAEKGKIKFKAFLTSDCSAQIQLIDLSITYKQTVKDEATNKAIDSNKFSASSGDNPGNLAESQSLDMVWRVNVGGKNMSEWVKYDMGSDVSLGSYEITPNNIDISESPKSWIFQGSKNDVDWIDLDRKKNISDWQGNVAKVFNLYQSDSYRYYRLFITESGNESKTSIARLRLMSSLSDENLNLKADSGPLFKIANTRSDILIKDSKGEVAEKTEKGAYIYNVNNGAQDKILYFEIDKNISISQWIAGSDAINKKAVIHLGSADRSGINRIQLIVGKAANDNFVRVCPGAITINEVEKGCADEIILTPDNASAGNYKLVSLEDVNFWHVEPIDINSFSTGIQSGAMLVGSMISHWKLDENSGCVAFDSFGANNGDLGPGCSNNSPTWVTGISGSGLQFDKNDRLVIPDSNSLDLTTQGTLSAWFKLDSYTDYAGIIHKGNKNNSSDSAYFLQFGGPDSGFGNNKRLMAGGNDGVSDKFIVSDTELNLNTWYHAVYAWDSAGQKLYINGNLDKSSNVVLNARITTGSLQLGSRLPNNYRLKGALDEIAIYNYSLSASQISSLYSSQLTSSIEVLSPNGGESLLGGSSYAIKWNSVRTSGNVKIEYSKDDFSSDVNTIISSTTDNGSYDWLVPSDISNTVKVRVSDIGNPSITDKSNSNFSITLSANINLSYPNGGEKLFSDSYTTITWSLVGISGDVKIEYSKDDFVSDINTITSATNNAGSYDWKVPEDPTSNAKIRITSVVNSTVKAISSNVFSIVVSNQNPVSYWPLNEGSGCVANDSYGGNQGTLKVDCPTSSPLWVSGKSEKALDFNGISDYVFVANAENLNPTTALSLSAWVKWDINPSTGQMQATIINKNLDDQYGLQFNATNSAFQFAIKTSNGNGLAESNTSPAVGVWYFVAGTYDGQTMKMYVNGLLEKTVNWKGVILGSENPLQIGARSNNEKFFNGIIDEPSLYNRALSASEVNQKYLANNNTAPEIFINSVTQRASNDYVDINYTIADRESNFIDLLDYEYSLTGMFSGEQRVMTGVTTDASYDGITALSSSPSGVEHNFVWNVSADLSNGSESVYIRLKPTDGVLSGNYAISSPFVVNVKKPALTTEETTVSGGGIVDTYKTSPTGEKILQQENITQEISTSITRVPIGESAVVVELAKAIESPVLQKPQVSEISGTTITNSIVFKGNGIPNSDLVLFIHSEQAVVYKTKADKNGKWQIIHSQNAVRLEDGEHEVYAVTLDAASGVKSQSSEVTKFNLKKNLPAIILSYFDLVTTLLTLSLTVIAIIIMLLVRKNQSSNQ